MAISSRTAQHYNTEAARLGMFDTLAGLLDICAACGTLVTVEDDPSTRKKQLDELRQKIADSAGSRARTGWSSLGRSHSIAAGNHRELSDWLDKPGTDFELALELVQNTQLPVVRDRFLNELDRRLHNYVASVGSLIDRTRILVRSYNESDFTQEYGRRRDALTAVPVAGFIRDLRNYTLHYDLPPVSNTLHWTQASFDTAFTISTETLTRWKGWKAQGRAYLLSHSPDLNLKDAVTEYNDLIEQLYSWVFSQFGDLHNADIAETNRLIEQFNHLLTGRSQ